MGRQCEQDRGHSAIRPRLVPLTSISRTLTSHPLLKPRVHQRNGGRARSPAPTDQRHAPDRPLASLGHRPFAETSQAKLQPLQCSPLMNLLSPSCDCSLWPVAPVSITLASLGACNVFLATVGSFALAVLTPATVAPSGSIATFGSPNMYSKATSIGHTGPFGRDHVWNIGALARQAVAVEVVVVGKVGVALVVVNLTPVVLLGSMKCTSGSEGAQPEPDVKEPACSPELHAPERPPREQEPPHGSKSSLPSSPRIKSIVQSQQLASRGTLLRA